MAELILPGHFGLPAADPDMTASGAEFLTMCEVGIAQRVHNHILLQREAARRQLYQNVAGLTAVTTALQKVYASPLCI